MLHGARGSVLSLFLNSSCQIWGTASYNILLHDISDYSLCGRGDDFYSRSSITTKKNKNGLSSFCYKYFNDTHAQFLNIIRKQHKIDNVLIFGGGEKAQNLCLIVCNI